ncbi:YfhO family protein [Candidatus Microgenomates bacterium]|nr:YfhO family protein [Candidatus Microgenomates bacterium]
MIIGILKTKILKVLLLLLITFDLLLFGRNFIRLTDLPTATADSRLIDYLKKDTNVFRVLPDFPVTSTVRRDFDFGAASLYRIPSTSDYNSMVLSRYYNFIDLLNKASVSSVPYYNVEIPPPNPKSSYINYLNVRYILSDRITDGLSGDVSGNYSILLEGERYRLYRNNNVLPRFFFVPQAQLYQTDKELEKALISGQDLEKTVMLRKSDLVDGKKYDLDCASAEKNKVETVSYSANSISLRTNSACNAFLSSSEVYYPGWRVKVDGKESKILLGNSAFRTIYLPKGQHSVEYYFSPKIYYFGLFITLFSFLLFWKIYTSGTSRDVRE